MWGSTLYLPTSDSPLPTSAHSKPVHLAKYFRLGELEEVLEGFEEAAHGGSYLVVWGSTLYYPSPTAHSPFIPVLSPCTLRSSSGSALTPIASATLSPIERVKAQPGKVLPGAHTRGGSPPLSSSSPRFTPLYIAGEGCENQ